MHINNNTGPWFESIADSNQGHTGHILSTHFPGYLSPTTRINLSLSLLKLCFQAGSFEYNYVEFEDKLQWVLTRGLLAKMSKKMGFIYLKFDHNTN